MVKREFASRTFTFDGQSGCLGQAYSAAIEAGNAAQWLDPERSRAWVQPEPSRAIRHTGSSHAAATLFIGLSSTPYYRSETAQTPVRSAFSGSPGSRLP